MFTRAARRLNGGGVRRLWNEAIKRAVLDLGNPRHSRQAYDWLFSDESEIAFLCCKIWGKDFRELLQSRIKKGTLVVYHLTHT